MAWSILTDFVQKSLASGIGRDRIRSALESAGWRPAEVKSAIDAFAVSDLRIAVPRPSISPTARELFYYLSVFSCLYVTIMGLGTILFQLVNLALPDPADYYGDIYYALAGGVEAKLRSGVASVVVFLPAYLLLDHRIEVLKRSDPGQGGSSVRRKVTYLTLYFTAFVLLSDASFLVSYWLNGELDARVLLKCGVVAGLGMLVLGRYLHEMTSDEHFVARHASRVRIATLAILTIVSAAAVLTAFGNFASPGTERKRQADRARETALAQIDNAIVTYFRAYESLPESLAIVARFQHVRFPRDPETGVPYRYEVVGDRRYRLCTTFRRARTAEELMAETGPYTTYYATSAFSEHPAGPHCFDMEVKELATYGGAIGGEIVEAVPVVAP
ncbi:hypothetical protein EKN06_09385 [Croceicoccus ponticola]|uniref:DUF5671 domain-containing protein n=1 Tax=Croceicoccus ponticola TaxID=2217664 RepID=A0A437GXM4_9SPHN|nr:DUF5671 domain-containing protein [Croceicoccus ponticola]RVQ67120.1 hypothetical protein EKN06_09385 [Croceicoccus ponticola]